jgi:hypothetical protein
MPQAILPIAFHKLSELDVASLSTEYANGLFFAEKADPS